MEVEKKVECCCISHKFLNTATENPGKIGVVHASGGAKIIKRHRTKGSGASGGLWEEFSELRSSDSPPIYQGDCSYTYSDILASVESLAARIRNVLDGGDDSAVIKPQYQALETAVAEVKNGNESESHGFANFRSMGLCRSEEYHYFPKLVGIFMVPSVEYIVSVLAVLRCGEAFVPLDPLWPKDRILSINVDLIIGSSDEFGSKSCCQIDAEHWLVQCGCAPVLCVSMANQDPIDLSSIPWPCEKRKQRPFCYVLYTSGSTGKPKGVCGTEIGLLNRFLWMEESYPLSTDEVLLFKTTISFIDHVQEFVGPLLTATTLIIPPLSIMKENLFHLVDIVEVYKISRLVCVPTLIKLVLPALRDVARCLRLLILSGEIFPVTLWESLHKMLPETTILNLYGSTEVSGDCTYFDCKSLPEILKTENLISVPIGQPLLNCLVILDGSDDTSMIGEICVGGHCISCGYISSSTSIDSYFVRLTEDSTKPVPDFINGHESYHYYFRTGDFARRLESNDLIFEGRKDRTVKVNGKRVAPEEIENKLRAHPDVVDAAVLCSEGSSKGALLEAHLIMNQQYESNEIPQSMVRHWMVDKLPMEMIPNVFYFSQSFPMTSTGKVDYVSLGAHKSLVQTNDGQTRNFLHIIQQAFSSALLEDRISEDDDFFLLGGDSIAAAHVAHLLGIDMRLLYMFPTPLKLQVALSNKEETSLLDVREAVNWELTRNTEKENLPGSVLKEAAHSNSLKRKSVPIQREENEILSAFSKCTKLKSHIGFQDIRRRHWGFKSKLVPCSLSRCNKTMYEKKDETDTAEQVLCVEDIPKSVENSIQHLWKVNMESCVDASPIVVCKNESIYIFIGSHSHKFSCVNAISGSVEWQVILKGRIECSAAVTGDFSQVVVGCYDGNIYFMDFLTGSVCWSFQTGAEVKSQPVVDKKRHMMWCGSHDHHLYALDYKHHICIHRHPCGGSIFGSPAINERVRICPGEVNLTTKQFILVSLGLVSRMLFVESDFVSGNESQIRVSDLIYVASTNGSVLAISIKDLPLSTKWQHELGAPIFGSLSTSSNGNVICCSVDGQIVALDCAGQPVWKFKAGGPIFAGPSISYALPSQVLVCCRSGKIYSLKQDTGCLLWDYNVGDPITASAYVDEYLQVSCDSSLDADRLLCVCSSSGIVQLLRISSNAGVATQSPKIVQEFARTLLNGDVFSSPVMIAGRIFVGCRDDFLHCLVVDTKGSVSVS